MSSTPPPQKSKPQSYRPAQKPKSENTSTPDRPSLGLGINQLGFQPQKATAKPRSGLGHFSKDRRTRDCGEQRDHVQGPRPLLSTLKPELASATPCQSSANPADIITTLANTMASSLYSPTILPRGASLFLVFFYIAALLLQCHILPVAGLPIPAVDSYSLLAPANNPVTMPIIGKRGVFDSTTGATIGGAIIVVVGVVIGLGCALIAVCGFPWKAMCARRSRVQDLDKGKEKDNNHAVYTTAPTLPPPPPTPSPRPNMRPANTPTALGGQYYMSRAPPPEALHPWNRLAVPGEARPPTYDAGVTIMSTTHPVDDPMRYPNYREKVHRAMSGGMHGRPQMYGREVDDASVEQQFHQQGAQPRGYI